MPPQLRTQDDEKYRDVEVSAVQEVEVVLGPELDVGAEPHDDEAGQREQEVEEEDDILDAGVATRVHGAAGDTAPLTAPLLHCSQCVWSPPYLPPIVVCETDGGDTS